MPTSFDIRSYASDDESEVVTLWNLVFPDDFAWNAPRDVIRRKLTTQPKMFLVASSQGRVCGTILAGFDGVRGWLHHLAVLPVDRRKGVATALVRCAKERLADLGCPKLNLQVRAGNDGACSFYASLGYELEDRASFGKRLGSWAAEQRSAEPHEVSSG